ncbi:uncharacterized protein RJT21DRAFT_132103 [Scheffersomyces amazonensis]|uniref:uncharacterized protein n=1 Tax=Scheffersomyces amazonensis TaxID=1078765 RepID=UPI00315D9A4C
MPGNEFDLASPQVGILHHYGPNKTAFEFTSNPQNLAPNVVIFIHGLSNGLLDVPYIPKLAESISKSNSDWVLIQLLFKSSYQGWGTSSLKNDTKDISKLIKYLRSEKGGNRKKVVLLGHSTGCQDTIEYLSKFSHEPNFDEETAIQAGILQAPVSDVEGLQVSSKLSIPEFNKLVQEVYDDYISQNKQNHVLPEKFRRIAFGTPITAYRFYSLSHPRGDDDYFSSYLTSDDYALSFGKIEKPLLVLYGSKDEFVPDYVNRQKLIDSWKDATNPKYWSPLSKILQGATHDIGPGSDETAVDDFIETVLTFIKSI